MEFGSPGAVPKKYRQILADEELVGWLAYRISMNSISPEDKKALASEFSAFLNDLANERTIGKLVGMLERAGGKERKMVQAALDAGLEKLAKGGRIEPLVEILAEKGLPLRVKRAVQDAVLEGIEACGRMWNPSPVVELLEKEWLSEEIHVKALEVAAKTHYVDYIKYMENTISLLEKEWASPELKEEAERALLEWGVEECLERADPKDPRGPLKLGERGMIEGVEVDKGKLVSLVLGLAANGNASERVRIKAVEAAAACPHVDREKLVEALGDVMDMEVPPALMEAVERVLEECGAQKFAVECAGKTTEELLQMRAGAKTGEKRFLDEALIERFEEWAAAGCTRELAAILEKKELTQRLRAEAERCLLEAVEVRGRGENANEIFKLLDKTWLPEKAHLKVVEIAAMNPQICRMRLVEALGHVLARREASHELQMAARKALPGAVEECIRMKGKNEDISLGAAASLFKKSGIPWEIINRVAEECNGTHQWTRVAYLFKRQDLPQETAEIAEKVLLESMDLFGNKALAAGASREDKKLIGYVARVLWERKLPESVYLKGIELCRRHIEVHGYMFVKALADMFTRPEATQKVKDAAERALLEEEIMECAATGYADFLVDVYKAVGVPETVREKIRRAFEMRRRLEEMGERRKAEEDTARGLGTPAPSGDQGFVDSRVKPPSGRSIALGAAADKIATDPTRKREIVRKD